MAHSQIKMEKGDLIKVAPIGFSWTVFFFAGFPPLIRGHLYMAVIMFVLWFFTFGFSNIILAFFYNKMYFNFLMEHGYRFTTVISGKAIFALENELEVRLEGKSDV